MPHLHPRIRAYVSVLLAVAAVGWLWWEYLSPIAGFRREVDAIIAGAQTRPAYAEARADQVDPGWRMTDILARRNDERPPDDQNSTRIVEKVRALLPDGWDQRPVGQRSRQPEQDEMTQAYFLHETIAALPSNARLPDNLATDLRADLDAIAPAVTAARSLAHFPQGQTRFTPAKNPFETPLPYTQNTRGVARLLALDVTLLLADNQPDDALTSTHAILNVARSIGDEPFLISQLVRQANIGVAIQSIERVLGRSNLPGLDVGVRLYNPVRRNQPETPVLASNRTD